MTRESRITLLSKEELPEEYQEYLSEEYRGEINIFRAVANNPSLLEGLFEYSELLSKDLTVTDRELVTFSVAKELESEYIWHQHVSRVLNDEITTNQLEAIVNEEYDNLTHKERILVEYGQNAVRDSVEDELHRELEKYYSSNEIVSILLVVGLYSSLNIFIESLDIPLSEDFVGWIPSNNS